MAAITVSSISNAAVKLTYAAATATTGDTVDNSSNKAIVSVKNGGGSSTTVSIEAKATCDEGFEHDISVTIPAGEERLIPLPIWVTDGATGLATVICNPVTSVTLAAFRKV